MEPTHYQIDPHREKPGLFSGSWAFHRIINRALFASDIFSIDVYLVNWPMIGSMEGDLHSYTEGARPSRRDVPSERGSVGPSLIT